MPTTKRAARAAKTPKSTRPRKCSKCHATLRDPSEWVRSKDKVLCAACYQALLYPNRKRGSQEIVD